MGVDLMLGESERGVGVGSRRHLRRVSGELGGRVRGGLSEPLAIDHGEPAGLHHLLVHEAEVVHADQPLCGEHSHVPLQAAVAQPLDRVRVHGLPSNNN